jgi:hypothetical protein
MILFTLVFSILIPVSRAGNLPDTVNGNLIREPELSDYRSATRTPGFSPVSAVVDAEGNPVN